MINIRKITAIKLFPAFTIFKTFKLQEGLKEIYGAQSAEFTNLVGIFDKMNANADGGVYYGEFITAAQNWEKLMTKENIDIAFKMFDKNGDGKISVKELKQVFNSSVLNNRSDKEVWEQLISEIDKDGDNEISQEEFHEAMAASIET